ncbi:MAG: MauE/DoxX family redox-associated membrane protein [Planctomycetota bacterium]
MDQTTDGGGFGAGADRPDRGRRPSGPRAVITPVFGLVIGVVLQFAAVAKLMSPSLDPHKQTTLFGLLEESIPRDYAIATAEMVVVMLILAVHRWKVTWVCAALMFAGFAGYAGYYTLRNEPCGCFGKLWTPPNGFTFTADVVFAVGSLCLAMAWGLRFKVAAGVTVAGVLLAGLGFAVAQTSAPPKKDEVVEQLGATGPELLQQGASLLPGAAEAFSAGIEDPVYYLFIHDPGCFTCEQMKLTCVDQDQEFLELTEDPFLRVRQLDVFDIRGVLEIPETAWYPTPTAMVVWGGEILHVWSGEEAPCPGTGATIGGPPEDDGVYRTILEAGPDALRGLGGSADGSALP